MKLKLTFSTHAFAKKVQANPHGHSCLRLQEMLHSRAGAAGHTLRVRDVVAWVLKQYPADAVAAVRHEAGRVIDFDLQQGTHPAHRACVRGSMARRLLTAPNRRASITIAQVQP